MRVRVWLVVVVAGLAWPFQSGAIDDSRAAPESSRAPTAEPAVTPPRIEVPSASLLQPSNGARVLDAQQFSLQPAASRLPEWLRRIDLGFAFGDDKPRFHVETVQPLFQSRDLVHTIFVQPRYSLTDGDSTVNVGVGYRLLFFDRRLLAGINSFYDYTDRSDHYRVGAGLELLSPYIELRTNGYFPLSDERRTGESGGQKFFERALRGFDLEGGGPVPYLPFLKLFGGYAFYDYEHDSNSHVGKVRAEVQLTRFLKVDAEASDDDKGPWRYRVGVVLTLDLERPTEWLARPSPIPYPNRDVAHMVLKPVKRDHEIKIERFSKNTTTGVTVAIRRGT